MFNFGRSLAFKTVVYPRATEVDTVIVVKELSKH